MTAGKTTVLIVDDHTIVRQGLRALLAQEANLHVIAEANDGQSAVQAVAAHRPDVVLLDLSLPDMPGTAVIPLLRSAHPDVQVLVLSMHDGEEYVRPAVHAGARGYLVKGSGLQDVVAAIGAVAGGHAFFSPAAAGWLLGPTLATHGDHADVARHGTARSDDERLRLLTPRERQVLALVARGLTSAEIGEQLAIASKTVETHRANLTTKLDLHDLPALVRFAVRTGLVPLDA